MRIKPVRGYEGKYEVSNTGRIFSLNYHSTGRRQEMKLQTNRIGYVKIMLSKNGETKLISVHRIVAEAFVPNPLNLPEVNHDDGIKSNNNDWNLIWCTQPDNQRHAFKIGLKDKKGEAHHNAKLINENIIEIRQSSLSIERLAIKFNVNPATIYDVLNHRTWKHI